MKLLSLSVVLATIVGRVIAAPLPMDHSHQPPPPPQRTHSQQPHPSPIHQGPAPHSNAPPPGGRRRRPALDLSGAIRRINDRQDEIWNTTMASLPSNFKATNVMVGEPRQERHRVVAEVLRNAAEKLILAAKILYMSGKVRAGDKLTDKAIELRCRADRHKLAWKSSTEVVADSQIIVDGTVADTATRRANRILNKPQYQDRYAALVLHGMNQ